MAVKILNGIDVDGSMNIVASDVPNLDASKITSGTFSTDRIPNLSGTYQPAGDYLTLETAETTFQPIGNYLTSIPSEYLTQTEGDARYLQSLPSHNHNTLYDAIGSADAVQTWVGEQNFATDAAISTAVSNYLPLSGGVLSGAINVLYDDHGNGTGWDKNLFIGTSDDLGLAGTFPTFVPSGSYGFFSHAYSDGVFIGSVPTAAGSSNYYATIAWGDDATEYFQFLYKGNQVARIDTAGRVYAYQGNSDNWNTAYGWGNHASVGYLTSLPSHNHDTLYDAIGSADAVNVRIDNEVFPALNDLGNTIPTNNNQLTNGAGYITGVPAEYLTQNEGDARYFRSGGGTLYKQTDTSGTSGTSFLTIHNNVGGDISQQQSFMDFMFTDTNANFTPQVRIGAQVGRNADANAISKEGAGAFVVYTGNGTDESGGGALSEAMRIGWDNKLIVQGEIQASGYNKTSWDTAFGWGNHASVGYLTSIPASYATDVEVNNAVQAVNERIETEVLPSIPTNNNQLTNGAGYITDGNTGWNNSYGFITNSISTGITINGSLSRGTYTSASQYHTGADNIVLKGNGSGISGLFFESEKNGTNINHPSDFGFIQYHAYGTSTSGESNELIIGVSNDADDHVVLNAPNVNGLKFRVGASETEYNVYHSGNLSLSTLGYTGATNANYITNNNQLTNGAGYATQSYVTTQINNVIDSAPGALNTLNELAAALGDDSNFSTTVANNIGAVNERIDAEVLPAIDAKQNAGNYASFSYITLNDSATTASFIAELTTEHGAFQDNYRAYKVGWSYAGNSNLDVGFESVELAGCLIECFGGTYKHVRLTRPTTGTGGRSIYVYNDQGSSYAPGWRQIWTSDEFSSANVSNWNTAYGWGNHASAGYLTSIPSTYATDTEVNTAVDVVNNRIETEVLPAISSITLASLGYTGATNANYITNNNQLTNGAGYTTNTGTITGVSTGTGLDGTATSGAVSITLDLSELTDMTATVSPTVDELILLDNGAERRKRFSEIFGSAAYQASSAFDSAGSADAVNVRIDNEVLPIIPTDTSHLTNGAGYITSADGGDADLLDGLDLGGTRANVANKVVRTDGNGYTNFGWINTTSGRTTSTLTDIYVNTNDGYIRKATPAHFRSQITDGSYDSIGSADAVNARIDGEVLPIIPFDNSQLTNGAGYITGYTETSTLDSVADRGRTTNQQLISTNPSGFRVDSGSSARIEIDSNNNWSYLRLMDNGATCWDIATFNNGSLEWRPNGGESNRMTLSKTGNLSVNGTIVASDDITAFSDARIKENVETLPNALDKVKSMRGVTYNKIGEEKQSVGVIAQELEEVVPQLVHTDEEGMKSVAYGNLTAVLIEALKEQQAQIEELKARLDGLTK